MDRYAIGLSLAAFLVGACGSSHHASDAGARDAGARDGGTAGQAGASPDAGPDSGVDLGFDLGVDVGVDRVTAPDAAVDLATAPDAGDARADGAAVDAADAGGADGPAPASGTPWQALAIATGVTQACALLDNHQVKCWGGNSFGCLGTGDGDDRGEDAAKMGNALPFVNLGTGRSAVAISAGRYTTCAILDTGDVKCWGLRMFTGAPANPADDGFAGNQPSDLGDALPALEIGTGRKATHIANGYTATCAVLDDGSARCWGGGAPVAFVGLDATRKVAQLAPALNSVVARFDDGGLSGGLSSGTSTGLALEAGQRAGYVAGSRTSECAVLSDGRLACSAGRAAPALADAAAVDVAEYHTCVLTKAGAVRCWDTDCGSYPPGTKYWCPDKPLADGSVVVALGQPATALGTAGVDFSCAVLADGGVKCWTRSDACTNAAGGSDDCGVADHLTPVVGGAVTIMGTGANRKFGAWRAIDLGTRP